MKIKKFLALVLCLILSLCVFVRCDIFDDLFPDSDDSADQPVEQPDKDADKDTDKDADKDTDKDKEPDKKPGSSKFNADDFLKVDGKYVKNKKNDTLYLCGVNAGGLFVTEHWMTGFQNGKTESDDYKSLTKTFINRFGEAKTQELWAEYRANWWTDEDFQNCADMGMTVIRLPFTYMNVDFAAVTDYENAGKNYDFSAIDDFVTKAAEYGLYTILDLHGAYGSQNGQDHSGEIFETKEEVDFYSNEKMQTLTVNLWSALSKHYKNNPAVAGYDILNEPAEKGGWIWGAKYWDVFDKIYRSIRETGDEHIVIFESCWDGGNLPQPTQYNWQNCIYSFHHYIDDNLSASEHMENWNNKFTEIYSHNLNLPLQMGEFTAYNSTEKWENTLKLLNDSEWHWTSWTYKVWGNMSWGIVNVTGNNSQKVDAANDSYATILQKFKILRTETAQKYRFGDSNRTLESLIAKSLTGVLNTEFELSKVGLIKESGKAYAVFSGTFGKYTKEELSTYVIDGEISGRVKLILQITEYNEKLGTFVMKAEIGGLAVGTHWLHAGFNDSPENLPAAIAKIDEENSSVTVNGKTYSLGENSGCCQIIVGNV